MDRSSKQKINKKTQVLNDTWDEMHLIDIFRTLYPNAEAYTFFSSTHGTFFRIDHILGHKSNLSKFKKIEIVSSIFSDHNESRYQLQEKNYKKHKHMEIKQHISKQPTDYWRNQKGNQKISRNKWQWNHDNSKPMGCSKSSSKREVYSNTILPQETRRTLNRQPNFTHKATGKRRRKKQNQN